MSDFTDKHNPITAPVVDLSPIIVDRSTAENYATCPFMASAIERGRVLDASDASNSGNEVHRIIGEAIKLRAGFEYGPEELREYMKAEVLKSRPDVQPDVHEALFRYVYEIAAMLCYAGDGSSRHPDDLMRYEGGDGFASPQLAAEMLPATDARGPVLATCAVDLLMAGNSIHELDLRDWKTGNAFWTAGEVLASFQFQYYAYIIMANYPGCEQVNVKVHMPRLYSVTPAVTFRRKDMERIQGRMLAAIQRKLEASNECWPALGKCELCPATHICPACSGMEMEKPEEGLVRQFVALTANLKAIKKTLDAHVRKNGDMVFENPVMGPISYGVMAPKSKPKFSAKVYGQGSTDDDTNAE